MTITLRETQEDREIIARIIAEKSLPGVTLTTSDAIRIALAEWATNHPEDKMNTTSKYDQARARMSELEFTDEQMDFIFADWSEGEEHYDWLLTASRDEIEDWGEAANWGRADDTVELENATICFLENPWSGTLKMMRWGEIVKWAEENVHESARDEWLREARKAAAADDSETLGTMIIGS